jgi:hypothetical protein
MDEDYKQKEEQSENTKPKVYIEFKPEFYGILNQVLNSVYFYKLHGGELTPDEFEEHKHLFETEEDTKTKPKHKNLFGKKGKT